MPLLSKCQTFNLFRYKDDCCVARLVCSFQLCDLVSTILQSNQSANIIRLRIGQRQHLPSSTLVGVDMIHYARADHEVCKYFKLAGSLNLVNSKRLHWILDACAYYCFPEGDAVYGMYRMLTPTTLYHHKVDVVTAAASRRSGNLSLHLIRVVLIVGREKVKENTLGASLESSIIATLNLNLP